MLTTRKIKSGLQRSAYLVEVEGQAAPVALVEKIPSRGPDVYPWMISVYVGTEVLDGVEYPKWCNGTSLWQGGLQACLAWIEANVPAARPVPAASPTCPTCGRPAASPSSNLCGPALMGRPCQK